MPWADHLYAADPDWWAVHIDDVRKRFEGMLWSQSQGNKRDPRMPPDVRLIPGVHKVGLGRNCLHFGSHGGYQAINFAYLGGAREIVLLGYDMRLVGGRRHFFGDHPPGLDRDSNYGAFCAAYDTIDEREYGIRIYNCTPGSALTRFEFRRLEDML